MNELVTRHLLTAEELSEVARMGMRSWKWENHFYQILLARSAEVVQEACQVLEKHGCSVKKELKSELYYISTLDKLFSKYCIMST